MFNLERYLGEARAVLFSAAILMQPGPIIEPVSRCELIDREGNQYPHIILDLNIHNLASDGIARWIKFYDSNGFRAYGGEVERDVNRRYEDFILRSEEP